MMSPEEFKQIVIDNSLESSDGELRRMFLWMKAALQFPELNQFI